MSNVPKSHPQITHAEAVKLAALKNVKPPFIMGIRGYYLDSMGGPGNQRGIYDDAILVVTKTGIFTYNGNTDPSVKRKGVAVIEPGVYPFKKGNHGISKPGGGYPALRPATPGEKIPCKRDGMPGIHQAQATNIHKGGFNGTSSLGCQTIYPTQWPDFKARAYDAMGSSPTIKYVLITEEWRRKQG